MILNLTGKIAPIACGLLCCCSMVYAQGNDTSEVMLLDTGWEFSQSGTEKWMRATVPGTVHQDLISHELLPNPFYGMNEKKIQWVENEDWEYRTSFIVSEEQLNRDGIQLIFEGLDTYADVYLNGSLLLKADNMFVGYTLPVKSVLRKGENHLYIYFHSPIRQRCHNMLPMASIIRRITIITRNILVCSAVRLRIVTVGTGASEW